MLPRPTADGDGGRADANDVAQRFRSSVDPRTCCVRTTTLQVDRSYPVVAMMTKTIVLVLEQRMQCGKQMGSSICVVSTCRKTVEKHS